MIGDEVQTEGRFSILDHRAAAEGESKDPEEEDNPFAETVRRV